jgi:hypothetical protein
LQTLKIAETMKKRIKQLESRFAIGSCQVPVNLFGFETNITNIEMDDKRLPHLYAIVNRDGKYFQFDIRAINGFPTMARKKIEHNGLALIANHMQKCPGAYEDLFNNL